MAGTRKTRSSIAAAAGSSGSDTNPELATEAEAKNKKSVDTPKDTLKDDDDDPKDTADTKEPEKPAIPEEESKLEVKEEEAQSSVPSGHAESSAAAGGEEAEKTAFPILLHQIVSDPSTDDCIHWLACGTRFMISDKKKFGKDVLPLFYGHAKFTSFTRRLKRWSFIRVPSGPFMGAYYNPNFRKGEPELAARVRYDHPTPLSGAAMQLNKAKLQAVAAGGAFMNPMVPASDGDRDALLRQMNMIQNGGQNLGAMGMMGMPQAGGNPNLESLYLAMSQQNAAGMPGQNNAVLQMAMAQEMQRQMFAQQNPQLAAMFLNNMAPQQQQQQIAGQVQQSQGQQNATFNINAGGGSASITPSSSAVASLQNISNNSMASNDQQQQNSNMSLTTLNGGKAPPYNSADFQLNYPNNGTGSAPGGNAADGQGATTI